MRLKTLNEASNSFIKNSEKIGSFVCMRNGFPYKFSNRSLDLTIDEKYSDNEYRDISVSISFARKTFYENTINNILNENADYAIRSIVIKVDTCFSNFKSDIERNVFENDAAAILSNPKEYAKRITLAANDFTKKLDSLLDDIERAYSR